MRLSMRLAALVDRWAIRFGAIRSAGLIASALSAGVMGLTACGPDNLVETSRMPGETDFAAVSEALGVRCGSLDCHGMAERNLRLYGQFGLRLSGNHVPGGDESTPDEHHENYLTLITLEPEALEQVVRGAPVSRLTLVRKARGTEVHKGGAPFPPGTAGDRCLVSWLEGKVDQASCSEASKLLERP